MTVPDHELESHVNRESPAISEENYRTVEMMVRLRKMEQSIIPLCILKRAEIGRSRPFSR